MWGYLILALGVSIIAIMLLVQNLTTTSEEDFYLTREVLEASMYDAVDYGTYAKSGKLVMSEQKFVEVFIRRFAESVTNNKDYTINFYDIHEYPPKATVLITTNSGETTVSSDSFNVNVNTYLNAILETISNYGETMTVSKKTTAYKVEDSQYVETDLTEGTEVMIYFKFLAENDPCGYYPKKDTNGTTVEGFTKSKTVEEGSDYTIDTVYEYCSVQTTDSSDTVYYVRKEALE